MNATSLKACFLFIFAVSIACSAKPLRKPACKRDAVLECKVEGDDSPEAALRQVDEHAMMTMYCAAGCDRVVNQAVPRRHATYMKPVCSVEKDENQVVHQKFKAKDDDKQRRSTQTVSRDLASRDIDNRTIKAATFRFCCTDQNGIDYTEAAARRIGLELSICKRL